MTNLYRIANIDIQITSMYESVHRYCKDYLVFGSSADLSLRTTQDDIDFERYKTAETDSYVNVPARQFRDDYLEVLAVYRKIAEALPDYNMFLMHGSCIAVDLPQKAAPVKARIHDFGVNCSIIVLSW